ELFPKSTWLRLIVVEFGLLVSGLLSLVLYVQASMTRKGFYVAYVLFGVYIFIVEKVRQWHVSRMIRRRMGPLVSSSGSFKAGGIQWTSPVSISQFLGAILVVAVLLYTLWVYQQKF